MPISPEMAVRIAGAFAGAISNSKDSQSVKPLPLEFTRPSSTLQFDTCPEGFGPIKDRNENLTVCWSEKERIMTVSGLGPGEKVIIPQAYCEAEDPNCLSLIEQVNHGNPDFEGRTEDGLIFSGSGESSGNGLAIMRIPPVGNDIAIEYGVKPPNKTVETIKYIGGVILFSAVATVGLLGILMSRKLKQI